MTFLPCSYPGLHLEHLDASSVLITIYSYFHAATYYGCSVGVVSEVCVRLRRLEATEYEMKLIEYCLTGDNRGYVTYTQYEVLKSVSHSSSPNFLVVMASVFYALVPRPLPFNCSQSPLGVSYGRFNLIRYHISLSRDTSDGRSLTALAVLSKSTII